MARSVKEIARQDVIFSVDEAYWQVVSLVEKRELAQSFVNLLDSLRNNVDIMLGEGVATGPTNSRLRSNTTRRA